MNLGIAEITEGKLADAVVAAGLGQLPAQERRNRRGGTSHALPGFSDSRWFRAAFPDCQAYGFFPHRHMTLHEAAPLIHGANERIDVRDLGFAADFFHDLPPRVLA